MQDANTIQREEQSAQEQAEDRTQSNPQTEESVPHEPGIRQEEMQPFTQSVNDRVEELFKDVEAPSEKFSLPLGSQVEGPSLARYEPYCNVSPAKEPNQEVTLPKPDIFKLWDKECREGDWVLVNTKNSTCRYVPGEDSAALSTIVAEAADDFYYAFYNKAKGKLLSLVANKIYNWSRSKSKNYNRVIYFFRKFQEPVHVEVGNINFDNFRGASTKIRLELIQASTDISVELMQASTEKRIGII